MSPLLNGFDHFILLKFTTIKIILFNLHPACLGRKKSKNLEICRANCGSQPFLKRKSYLEKRTLSLNFNLSFLYSRRGLQGRMDKKSDILIFFAIKSSDLFCEYSSIQNFPCNGKVYFPGLVLYVQLMQPQSHSLLSKIVLLQLCKVF